MNTVQPIRDKHSLELFKNALKDKGYKYYIMAQIGFNTGLRIGDILSLKVFDIKDTHINIQEEKTGKRKRFLINNTLRTTLDSYIKCLNLQDNNFLIPSNKKDLNGFEKPISRIQAYNVLVDAANIVGLKNVGTHTLRKTFGYWHYKMYRDVAILQSIFNHSSPSITLVYIGITADIIDSTIQNFNI